jgi:GT2 family glycosyltransferase
VVHPQKQFGAVVIGRNEGERLKRCLTSLSLANISLLVYVDSGSTDGSGQWACAHGVTVVDLDMRMPFTAARARNTGFHQLRLIAPSVRYVQFIDGDCELLPGWIEQATRFLDEHAEVAVVAGRLRERHPERSVYNWLCEREWDRPTGDVHACGGIAMMRVESVEAVGGFREDMIAGEESELCLRLRRNGGRIWRLTNDMAVHDAAMTRFSQWWKRIVRSGYSYANGAHLHGRAPERYQLWEARRGLLWGLVLPLACLVASIAVWPWGLAAWLIYPLQVLRQTIRNRGRPKERALLALFQVLSRFPEGIGQVKFMRDRIFGLRSALIEYK